MTSPLEEPVQTVNVDLTTTWELCGDELAEVPIPSQDTDTVPASILVSPVSLSLLPAQTVQLSVTVRNKNGKIISTTPSFSSSNNSIATVNSTGLVAGGQTSGTCSIIVTAGNISTSVNVVLTVPVPAPPPPLPPPPSGTGVNEAEFPRVLLNTARSNTPSLGNTFLVHSADDFTNALNNCVGGDNIVIDAALVLPGNWQVPTTKAGIDTGHWITIKKAGTLTPENTRIRYADALSLGFPIIRTTTVSQAMWLNGPQASFYRFINILFDIDPAVTVVQAVVWIGDSGNGTQKTVADCPHDIIFDCCCVHELDNQDGRKGVVFDGINLAYVDGDISNVKSTFDAQCITSTNGPGPFKVVNNFLEATGENIAWGGATPLIPNLISSDIEVRKNHFYKNPAWIGTTFGSNVKNHYESKNSQRAWIRGNILENCWLAGQAGYSFVLWSANSGDSWATTAHQTVEFNWIKNTVSVFQLSEWYDGTTTPSHHFTIKNNLATNINNTFNSGVSRLFTINYTIAELVLKHNTMFSLGDDIVWTPDASPDQIWQDNLLAAFGAHMFTSQGIGSAAWALVGGAGSLFVKNIVMGLTTNQLADNFYPTDLASIKFVGPKQGIDPTADIASCALDPSSPYHNAASDGTDIGVDTVTLASEVAGVA